MSAPVVGILALQGAFSKHKEKCDWLSVDSVYVRSSDELKECTHLIIPGGESTTMTKLIDLHGLRDDLIEFGKTKYIWGTCAGMILLAKRVDDERVDNLGLIDIHVDRNAYGRQVDSFVSEEIFPEIDEKEKIKLLFIRAPKIVDYGDTVQPLGYVNGTPVLARNENIMVSSFHPELTADLRIHNYFIFNMDNHK